MPARIIVAVFGVLLGSLTACTQQDAGPEPGDVNSELIEAIRYGQVETIKGLLEGGADVNVRDTNGLSTLAQAIVTGQVEVVKLLLQSGADVNLKDGSGITALARATGLGAVDSIEILLGAGADINAQDNSGKTAWGLFPGVNPTPLSTCSMPVPLSIQGTMMAGRP